MVYFADAKAYFEQSKLLLQARPSTTKISTKYTLPKPTAKLAKSAARQKPQSTDDPSSTANPTSAPTPAASSAAPKAILTLRTYDPVSGTVLKYQTDKQAEVGRLVAGLGRCARTMAALPEEEEAAAAEQLEVDAGVGTAGPARGEARAETPVQGQGAKAGGGGGGKKKKKNKK